MRPPPLVITADMYYPAVSGLARFVKQLAEGMGRRGYPVHLVVPSWIGVPVTVDQEGVTIHGVRSRRLFPTRPSLWMSSPRAGAAALPGLLSRVRPGLVHINGHLLLGRAATTAAVRSGVPVVATNHFMPGNIIDEFPLPGAVQRPIARALWADTGRVLRRATVVTAPTSTAVDLLATEAKVPMAVAVSCGVDLARFGATGADGRNGIRILYVGRLDREKRVDDLLRAFATLPGFELDLVGTGKDDAVLRALASRLGVADRVRFRGGVSDAELRRAYAEADVFCMPGVAELQSIATLEALAAGLPVVGANAAALPHLIRHGVTGWLYPPGDTAALANHLSGLLSDETRRAEMGRAGRALAARHNLEATLDRYESVYRTAGDGPGPMAARTGRTYG